MWKTILSLLIKSFCFFVLAGSFLLTSCREKDNDTLKNNGVKVAKVGDSYLYEKDLIGLLSKETSGDSIALRERFINNWIREKLLLERAKINLSQEEQNVEELVDKYRYSLLINLYKQKYLAEHLDTLVTEEDVKNYVKENSEAFILKEPIYQYYLAKVLAKNRRDIYFILNLFSEENVNLMQDFKLENTTIITNYDVDWYKSKDILRNLPDDLNLKDLKSLREGKVFTFKDDKTTYLLKPIKIIKAGEMEPYDYIERKVKGIILHNRKLALAKQLEYEIYEVAKAENQFTVY